LAYAGIEASMIRLKPDGVSSTNLFRIDIDSIFTFIEDKDGSTSHGVPLGGATSYPAPGSSNTLMLSPLMKDIEDTFTCIVYSG